MLTQLSIRNFALIASADIAFSTGFTSITGETGSGKSILLGALNLILGERADYSVIRDTDKKTVVEAVFQIADTHKEWFLAQDIDWENETVIRREITAQGKSRAFINDTPVQLTQLKELTEQLIYIHSQHQTLELKKPGFQLASAGWFCRNRRTSFPISSRFQTFQKRTAAVGTIAPTTHRTATGIGLHSFSAGRIGRAGICATRLFGLRIGIIAFRAVG